MSGIGSALQASPNGELTDQFGNVLAGRQVYVYQRNTTSQVQVYSDQALTTVYPTSQPLTVQADGSIPGYVDPAMPWDFVDATDPTNRKQGGPLEAGKPRVFNVTDYGALGDASTDDTSAVLTAQAGLMTAGGGILWFPMTAGGGTYLLNGPSGTPTVYSGVSYAIPIYSDHVRVEAAPGVTYKTTANAATFFITGAGKVSGMANWNSNRVTGATTYNLTGTYAVGAMSVTLNTSGDASNFAVGDWIYIRTGQCTSVANNNQPDAEINQVTKIAGGVLSLRWPLSRPLAQEYFATSGLIGPTSTTSTSWPATFAVAKITDRVIRDISFRGGKFNHTGDGVTGSGIIACAIFGAGGIFGLDIKLEAGSVIGGDLIDVIEVRHGRYDWGEVHFSSVVTSGGFSARHLAANADTGCTDIQMKGTASAEKGVVKFEIHEGAAMVKADVLAYNPVGDASVHPTLDIAGRQYGGDFDVAVVNAPSGAQAPVNVDASSPSTAAPSKIKARVYGDIPANHISILSPGYALDAIVPDGAKVQRGLSSFLENPQVSDPMLVLPASIKFSDTTPVVIGTIPPNADLIGVRVQVSTAFNDATTNTIDIGTSGSPTSLVSGLSVAQAGQLAVPLLQSGWSSSSRGPFQVRYNGASASNGYAVISMIWARGMKP